MPIKRLIVNKTLQGSLKSMDEETKQVLETDLGMTQILETSDKEFKRSMKQDPVMFSNI